MFDGQVCPTTVVAVDTVEALQISRLAVALTLLQYPDAIPTLLKVVQQRRSASSWATLARSSARGECIGSAPASLPTITRKMARVSTGQERSFFGSSALLCCRTRGAAMHRRLVRHRQAPEWNGGDYLPSDWGGIPG
ncbi:MAG TPA: hypothetical protein VGW38_02735 [Chloroflexota bacterium]|nr:hypothetical protein [Chloroflexota bacterium]